MKYLVAGTCQALIYPGDAGAADPRAPPQSWHDLPAGPEPRNRRSRVAIVAAPGAARRTCLYVSACILLLILESAGTG